MTIKYVINCGEKVAFAVPRKDVVIELYNRLKMIFCNNKVVSVYGGHNKDLYGDIVVLTTHQLFRYKNYFSLIILDEIDAFPFKNNVVLKNIFFNSLCGHYIFMSATPTKDALQLFKGENKEILKLDIRFHRHPLPVPIFVIRKMFIRYIALILIMKDILSKGRQLFVFAPTIEECEMIYKYVSLFFKNGNYVHSKHPFRNEIISEFKQKKWSFLVTTSVLERGVTVKSLDVIVIDSDSKIYDSGTLIQIAGRAGRKKDDPTGKVIFIAKKKTKEMEDANASIIQSNKALQNMF